jgi:hypothetical protein
MTDAREIRALLEDRPDLEPALESLLETDDAHETWTFDDTGLDSGTFGELVSEDVVEKVDGEYRLADAEATERALTGEVEDDEGGGMALSLPSVDVDRRVAAALTGALLLVFCFRILAFEGIFQNGRVVLSGNDPYFYLYWTEELSRQSGGVLDLSALTAGSFGLLKGEPLLVATLWFVTELAGGIERAPLVLAWYPVAAGVVTGFFTYLLATGLTDDQRVGVASVVMLAVMPVLAFRSGLGYADHHAFDYVWLSMTAAGAVRLVRTAPTRAAVTDRRTLAWAGLSGLAIAGQLLAWDAGPLLLFPLALYIPFAALIAAERGERTALVLAPLAVAFAVAAVLTVGVHLALDWQTTVVAFTPTLLLAGTAAVAAVGTVVERVDLPFSRVRVVAAAEASGTFVALAILATVLSSFGDLLLRRLGQVGTRGDIVEANSLFATRTFGWLFLFGFILFLGIPYMGLALARAASGEDGPDRRGWLLAGSYGWLFLVLATFQMRFAGELSSFLAVFAGFGFVHIAERVDLARPPVPFREVTPVRGDGGDREPAFEIPEPRGIAALLFLFLLVTGLSIAQAPVKANQVPIDEHKVETAVWIDGYAEEQGIEHPETRVLSSWSRNRMYNYFVSGESQSYGFALNNYEAFLRSTQPDTWYDRLDGQVGVVVFNRQESGEATLHSRLTNGFGSRHNGHNGSGHYQALRVTNRQQVHRVVPGADVTGTVHDGTGPAANTTVQVRTEITVTGLDSPRTYFREVRTDGDGRFDVRVAYPGEYEVIVSNTTTKVTVGEAAVENGERVDAGTLRMDGNATADGPAHIATPAYQVSPS